MAEVVAAIQVKWQTEGGAGDNRAEVETAINVEWQTKGEDWRQYRRAEGEAAIKIEWRTEGEARDNTEG